MSYNCIELNSLALKLHIATYPSKQTGHSKSDDKRKLTQFESHVIFVGAFQAGKLKSHLSIFLLFAIASRPAVRNSD